MYIKKLYSDDPSFRGSKIVYSLFGSTFDGTLDPRFEEKLRMDGFTDKDLAPVAGKPIGFSELAQLALAHSDGVVIHTKDVAPELLKFIEDNHIPCLTLQEGDENIAEKCTEFYNTL